MKFALALFQQYGWQSACIVRDDHIISSSYVHMEMDKDNFCNRTTNRIFGLGCRNLILLVTELREIFLRSLNLPHQDCCAVYLSHELSYKTIV